MTHYKEMIAEREKLKTTLSQSQDRTFRRMSELREQIQLDQLAKKDLEDNYRLMLEERDEFTKVLQMQVCFFLSVVAVVVVVVVFPS